MYFPFIFVRMKLPLKPIAMLVILSLVAIFAYQTYWLTGVYRTMKNEMERNISESMRMSDYNEMMLRIKELDTDEEEHGSVSVSAGYDNETDSMLVKSRTVINKQLDKNVIVKVTGDSSEAKIISKDSTQEEVKTAMLDAKGGMGLILKDKNNMMELATYFQRGLHSGLDILLEPNLQCYDSLLSASLKEKGIELPYRLEYLYHGAKTDSGYTYIDTVGICDYSPGPDAQHYDYVFDINTRQTYRLWIDPVTPVILKQMSGILATSVIIILILSFSFWFLIHTLLRQKTLEEMKSDFTNNVTHELKTPIAVAYAANDALLNFNQAVEKEKRDKYLYICQEQLQRLSGLVEQILSMSMEQRRTFRFHREEVLLKPLLDSLIEQHKLKADKPVIIHCQVTPENLSVMADRTHFGNILSNLIDNAIKYSSDDTVITIKCNRHANQVQVSVSDNGIGIPHDKQKLVFDQFYRVPTGNQHNVKGYGLGLYYVRTMIEKMGGTVNIQSEPGHGSTFIITL